MIFKYWKFIAGAGAVIITLLAFLYVHHIGYKAAEIECNSKATERKIDSHEKIEKERKATDRISDSDVDFVLRSLGIMRRTEDR